MTLRTRSPLRTPRRLRVESLEGRDVPAGYFQTNLASDIPGQAQIHDPELVDAQGISINPNGTFWVSGRATDLSTVYSGDVTPASGSFLPFVKSPLTVAVRGGAPTGQVFSASNTDFIVPATRPPAPISDPAGDFLSTYTGPQDPALDVVAHEARVVDERLEFFGRMAGPVAATSGFYLIGVDRGQGTPRFLTGSPLIGPNVTWDLLVRVNPNGTGLVNNQLTGVSTPLDPADIRITGNEFTASVPLSLLSPAPATMPLLPPEQWTYNLWPRNLPGPGQNQFVSDLAPDDGNSPVHGMGSGPARFIFASETGHITGWNPGSPPPASSRTAHIMATTPGAVYTGLAIGNNVTGNFLYAADFVGGKIDVFDRAYTPTTLGSFVDPAVPADYEPFNIWNLGGKLYVAYARQLDGDALPDGGHGYISVFDTTGNLVSHLIDDSHLKEPWGMALAPTGFGEFGGALLVANTANGKINAYDPDTGRFLGRLADPTGETIHIKGLWALHFGNGRTSGDANALYFTAAENHEHGLFGSLRVNPDTPAVGRMVAESGTENTSKAVDGLGLVSALSGIDAPNTGESVRVELVASEPETREPIGAPDLTVPAGTGADPEPDKPDDLGGLDLGTDLSTEIKL